MRPIKRAIHLDFHTLPGICDFNKEWDAQEFANILDKANVKYINAFARCNIGFAYYPTKFGIPYPGMKGDMFGDLLRECHKKGIGVSAYINTGIDHEHAIRHLDWVQIDSEGKALRGDKLNHFFRMMCYNNPEYNEYHFEMLKEICQYDVDGVFFDCMVIQPCYCPHCVKKMQQQGIDHTDVIENMRFQEQSIMEFSKKSKQLIGDNKYLLLNGMNYGLYNKLNTHIEVECLPGAWGYDYFWSRASYARKLTDTVVYMTGRFQLSWGDFGGFKTKESLLNDYYDALCAGVEVSVGDHMNPGRNLEKDVYKVVEEINSMICKLEPYTQKTIFMADIGVVINRERPLPTNKELFENGTFMTDSYPGLSRMLGELRQSYDIINETMFFDNYKLIILPDNVKMNDTLKHKLEGYLKVGGKVLSTGLSALNDTQTDFVMTDWDFTFCGLDKSNSSYYSFLQNSDPKLYDMQYSMYNDIGIYMKADRVIAKYVKAYFDFHWDGIHGYSYAPPANETKYAAAAISTKENVCHISFDVFRSYYKSAAYPLKALVGKCIELLLPKPLIKTDGIPSTARVTVTGCDEYKLVHVKVSYPELRGKINVIEEQGVLTEGTTVLIKGDYKSACTLPDKTLLKIVNENDYTKITLPKIVGYQMIYLI